MFVFDTIFATQNSKQVEDMIRTGGSYVSHFSD